MKRNGIRIFSLLLAVLLVFSIAPQAIAAPSGPSSTKITTTPTGYDSADDVVYKTYNQGGRTVIANWGARGETCTFLSSKAQAFYTGNNTFEKLSQMDGSKYQNSVPSSELYKQLQQFMKSKHTNIQSYNATREFYRYTDCVSSNTSKLSTFYTGKLVNSAWDSGKTYNREHTWPNSKGLDGRDEDDIMMLRPESPNDNTSRGNKAYGESGGTSYFDPGVSVRGDCARILLYIYVRWGNTGKMWGSSGVIENINVLFKWMEEDPVDTWEMGRNDSVQSITGTRNVFIDYPELAFIMFGREIPANMTTPSGNAGSGSYNPPACQHTKTEIRGAKQASCTQEGYTGDTYCKDCGAKLSTGTKINATGHADSNRDNICDICGTSLESCNHSSTEVRGAKEATCSQEGYTGDTFCKKCNLQVKTGEAISATPHTEVVEGAREATCVDEGATGTTTCSVCKTMLKANEPIPATGEHTFGEWAVTQEPTETKTGTKEHTCSVCSLTETEEIPVKAPEEDPTAPPTEPSETPTEPDEAPTEPNNDKDEDPDDPFPTVWIIVAIAAALGGCAVVVVLIVKKKKD